MSFVTWYGRLGLDLDNLNDDHCHFVKLNYWFVEWTGCGDDEHIVKQDTNLPVGRTLNPIRKSYKAM